MKTTIIEEQEVTKIEQALPENTPFVMLNLLRFKEQADYQNHNNIAPCSGQEAYLNRYVPAFNKAAKAEGIVNITN